MSTLSSTVGRAAAILTNSEVLGAALDMQTVACNGLVTVDLDFTIGSLTNIIVRFYGSSDGVTYKPLADGNGLITETLTASATRMYALSLPGVRYFKASVEGTGTLTSSTCNYTYRYQPYLTASPTDGSARIS